MPTEILKIKGDWEEVVNDCRSTVGKEELGKEPSEAFKRGILIAEHSPIRDIIIKWRWRGIKYWITGHWARHKWEKYIRSQRTDRTGVPRDDLPQSAPVDFTGEANAQHLIDTMRRRLCRTAHRETRAYAEDLKISLHATQPELSNVLVPNCVYRGGCPEMEGCTFWDDFNDWVIDEGHSFLFTTIQQRYDLYNSFFYESYLTGKEADGL